MLGALGVALLVAAAPAGPAERPRVAAVRLELPTGEVEGSLRALVAVRPGEPLSPREVRLTVQRIFATGRCGDVVARSEPAGEGAVEVVLTCAARRVVASVRVELAAGGPLDAEGIRRAAGLEPGSELWPGRLEEAATRVRAAYARRGWRSALAEARAEGQAAAEVTLAVTPGAPTRIEAVEVTGARTAGAAGAISLRAGDVLDLDALDEELRAVRGRLRAAGWLRARVADPDLRVEGERATVRVAIEAGPRVAVRFAGARAFSAAELADRLALASEPSLDATALTAAAARLRAFYRSQGFADARVDAEELALPGGVLVEVRVGEGRRYRVDAVTFAGTSARDAAWLRARLDEALDALAPPPAGDPGEAERLVRAVGSPARVRSRPAIVAREVWDPPLWDEAAQRVVEAYRGEGYLEAAHEGTRATLDARAGTVDLELRFREGVRTLVRAVAYEGNAAVPQADLAAVARLARGDPLSYGAVEATRAALLALYGRRGHLYARVVDVEELSADRSMATVTFRIEEGPRVRVGSVLVAGARRTQESVVLETVALRAGDVYDPEAAARSQAALLRLGAFRSVGLRLSDPEVPGTSKDLTVDIAERPWRSLSQSFGFSLANGPRAVVELVQPNVSGRALQFTARGKVNYPLAAFRPDLEGKRPIDRIEGRADVGLHDPRFALFGPRVGARVDGVAEQAHRRAYDLTRGSVLLGFDIPAARGLTLTLQYELEGDNVHKSPAAAGLVLTRADIESRRLPDGFTALQSFRPVVALDLRDDPLRPRRGWFLTGTADYAHSIGSSTDPLLFGLLPGSSVFVHMLKLSATASGYLPAGDAVLAVSLRAGRVFPLDAASQTIGPKRFFLGGAATMRGYGEEEMIPEDVRANYLEQVRTCAASLSGVACSAVAQQLSSGQTLVSEGGEAFALGKFELRFPVRDTIEMGLFADVGNLWLDPHQLGLNDLRANVGFGIHLASPIGPVVFDLGFNLSPDARLGEKVAAPHFSIGVF